MPLPNLQECAIKHSEVINSKVCCIKSWWSLLSGFVALFADLACQALESEKGTGYAANYAANSLSDKKLFTQLFQN